MSCQCFHIGGPFIGADPDCAEHGTAAEADRSVREQLVREMQAIRSHGTASEIEAGFCRMLQYLESLD